MLCTVCYIFANISFQGLSLFMPTVVSTRSYLLVFYYLCSLIGIFQWENSVRLLVRSIDPSTLDAHFGQIQLSCIPKWASTVFPIESIHWPYPVCQLLTVPPYLVGAVWALCSVYYSFRTKQRAIPLLINALVMVLGYALAVGTKNSHARYLCQIWQLLRAILRSSWLEDMLHVSFLSLVPRLLLLYCCHGPLKMRLRIRFELLPLLSFQVSDTCYLKVDALTSWVLLQVWVLSEP